MANLPAGSSVVSAASPAGPSAAERRADVLRAVIESISGGLSLDAVLSRIVENAVALLGAGHGGIGLTERTADGIAIIPVATHNLPVRPAEANRPPVSGLTGAVLRARAPVRLARYADLPEPARPEVAEHAALGVPIWWRGELIGVLGLTAAPPYQFDAAAVETLTLFAEYAAIAVETARRFEHERRRAARQEAIARVGRTITRPLSLDEVLQAALSALSEAFNYHTIAVMLVDAADPEVLVTQARGGLYLESVSVGYRQRFQDGIAGEAALGRRAVLINDVRADPRYIPIPNGDSLVAELAIPLIAGDRLLGVLNIEAERPFSAEEQADFEIIAGQFAAAIENARLYTGTRALLEEATLLAETSRRMSMAADERGITRAYLEQVAAGNQFRVAVALYEDPGQPRGGPLMVHGRWSPWEGYIEHPETMVTTDDGFDFDLAEGRTVLIRDYRNDPRVSPGFREQQRRRGLPPALAILPLVAGGRRLGFVILSSREPRDWSEGELHPFQVTAAHLAAAIANSRGRRLLSERDRQLAVMEERQRLARELHDAVAQSVFSASLVAQSLASVWGRDRAEAERRVARLVSLTHTALSELRTLVAELRPGVLPATGGHPTASSATRERLQREGLAAVLTGYAASLAGDGAAVKVIASGYLPQEIEREAALFRIAQEALHNALKYASAAQIVLSLLVDQAAALLTVTDNGAGFDPAATGPRPATPTGGGQGLTIMRERAAALGGDLTISSSPGSGTVVSARLPRRDREGG